MGTKPPIVDTPDPAIVWAEKLWEHLQQGFLDIEATIIAIIEAKAWEPLGYESFAKAWVDKMSNISIAIELRPHVVYQMFSEGLTPEQVAAAVKGIGVKMAEALKRQRDNGVPADLVTPSKSRKPLPYTTLFIKVPRDTLKQWKAIAKANGMKVEEVAFPAVESAFKHLTG